jgi:hypothetical protein
MAKMGIWVKYNADADGLMLDEDVPMPMNAKNVVESDGRWIDDENLTIDRPSCYCTWDYLIPQPTPP